MTSQVDLIKDITELVRRNKLPGFDCPGQEISVKLLFALHLCDVYRVASSPEGAAYTIKINNGKVSADVLEAYYTRESLATTIMNNVVPGMSPTILAVDASSRKVIVEDMTGCETLQHRIIVQSQVDHGITCTIARHLARLHKGTHIISLGDTKFTELSLSFCNTSATELLVHNTFVRSFEAAGLSSAVGSETMRIADRLLRQAQFQADLDDIRQLFMNCRECVIHGNINMTNVVVKDGQHIQLLGIGYAQLGPGAHDIGCLVAHYMAAYYIHMMTEQDNSTHRQVAYSMQDAVTKTVDSYLEEQTAYSNTIDQHRIELIGQISAFAGVELMRRALDVSDCSHYSLTDHIRFSLLNSGHRLISKYNAIDNAGRMLMIGLQLC